MNVDSAPRPFDAIPFALVAPSEQRVPFVFNSPHSGQVYPASFLAQSQLDGWQIRRSEDSFVNHLWSSVVELGAPLLAANFPRAYLDVNRAPSELDPAMFAGALPYECNTMSPRVAGGLGVIPKIVGEGRTIYRRKLSASEAIARIETCYVPYHRQLRALIEETKSRFGFAILVDCHSMPGAVVHPEEGFVPDFIVGDRFGQSAAHGFTASAIDLLSRRGYRVSLNRPYAGGFITEHYGRPYSGVHAIQIELNRRRYMDESRFAPLADFDRVRADLADFAAELVSLPDAIFGIPAIAAE